MANGNNKHLSKKCDSCGCVPATMHYNPLYCLGHNVLCPVCFHDTSKQAEEHRKTLLKRIDKERS